MQQYSLSALSVFIFRFGKTSFHMWGSNVSPAIYRRANPYTWFININDKQHKGATAQCSDDTSVQSGVKLLFHGLTANV